MMQETAKKQTGTPLGLEKELHPEKYTKYVQAGLVKTEGIEKTIAFISMLSDMMWRAASEHKSFRLELEYDAKAPNAYFTISVPTKSESDEALPAD